jgi:ferredoxin
VPVPELMRAYMYAYGYKDLALSKQVLNDLNIGDDVCQNCNECLVQCPDGFNVAEKTKDIIRLKQVPDDLLV